MKFLGLVSGLLNWEPSFYSGPSIFAVLRNLVQEIWFEKSGSRKVVREKWLTRKKCGFILQIYFFSGSRKVVDEKIKSEFAEPLF